MSLTVGMGWRWGRGTNLVIDAVGSGEETKSWNWDRGSNLLIDAFDSGEGLEVGIGH